MRRALRRQILRQRLPLATGRQYVENRVENLANIHLAPPAAALGRRDHRLDQRPFGIGQIARITQTAALSSAPVFRFPHLGTPVRIGCQIRNHKRFIRLNNFLDRLPEPSRHIFAMR